LGAGRPLRKVHDRVLAMTNLIYIMGRPLRVIRDRVGQRQFRAIVCYAPIATKFRVEAK
jgi:hypothetical protein